MKNFFQKGITFIEMLIVIVVLAIVAVLFIKPAHADEMYIGDDVTHPSLRTDGFCYFDWYRPDNLAKQKQQLQNMQTLKLQSRFQWQGYSVTNLTEHAYLAFTYDSFVNQGGNCAPKNYAYENFTNSPAHPQVQWLHKYGAGVILAPEGLGLELWNGNGTALLWNQTNNRCVYNVPTGATNQLCLGDNPSAGSYITSNANFVLTRGKYYWMRVTYTPAVVNGQTWVSMKGELIEETANGAVLLQEGVVGFNLNQFFPGATMQANIGRTGPAQDKAFYQPYNVKFWAFDFGF